MPQVPRKTRPPRSTRSPSSGRPAPTTVRRTVPKTGKSTTVLKRATRKRAGNAVAKKNGLLSGGVIWLLFGALIAAAFLAYIHHKNSSGLPDANVEGPRSFPNKGRGASSTSSRHVRSSSNGITSSETSTVDRYASLSDNDRIALKKLDSVQDDFRRGSSMSGDARNKVFKAVIKKCREVLHDPSVGDYVKQQAQKILASANKHMTN